jgi:hypothetical protein
VSVELTPSQSAAYSLQYQPQHITQVEILGEKHAKSIVAAFSTLPGIGEIIYMYRLTGDTDVLEIVTVTHWAVQIMPGQSEFPPDSKHFVDATITCRRSSISEQKRKDEQKS